MVGSVFFYFVFVKEKKMQSLVYDQEKEVYLFIYLFFGSVYTSLQISVLEGESYTSQH